jgi:signal transduction histidine kinase
MVDVGSGDSDEQLERLQRGRALVRQGIRQAREIVASLRPARLDALGLVAALRYDVRDLGERLLIEAVFEAESVHFSGSVETTLYRVVHEALNNVAKHAQATKVRVALRRDGERFVVTVEDNGIGFASVETHASPLDGGVGMISMRRRTELLEGRFEVSSTPGHGTTVSISLPLTLVATAR